MTVDIQTIKKFPGSFFCSQESATRSYAVSRSGSIHTLDTFILICEGSVRKFLLFRCNKNGFCLIVLPAISLLFRKVPFPSTTEVFIIEWDKFFCSLLTKALVRFHQPSCHEACYFAIAFEFIIAKNLCFTPGNNDQLRATNSADVITASAGYSLKKIYAMHTNFLTDRPASLYGNVLYYKYTSLEWRR